MLSLKSPISARQVLVDASGGWRAHYGLVDRPSGTFRTFLGDLYEYCWISGLFFYDGEPKALVEALKDACMVRALNV